MKHLFSFLTTILLTASLWAQSPEKMSYQAVIRNSANALVINQSIGMQISILQGSAKGTKVYTENQTTTTNANGLVSIEIGTGISSDDFSAINWENGPFFIQTATDPTGGANFTIMGTSQLLSVPYALYANTTASSFRTKYHEFTLLNSHPVNVYPTWTPLGITPTKGVTFTKQHDSTTIEVFFDSRVFGGTFAGLVYGVLFSITIDDMLPDYGTRGAITTNNTLEQISFTSVFTNLSAGTYSVKVVASVPGSTSYSANVLVDSGGFYGGFIVKETW